MAPHRDNGHKHDHNEISLPNKVLRCVIISLEYTVVSVSVSCNLSKFATNQYLNVECFYCYLC